MIVKFDSSRLPQLATLGRRRILCGVNQPEQTTWDCRVMLGNHLCARLVKFNGHMRH
jgi:hypothetical protein